MNYYNENDPYAAQWLRNLIADGRIPAGEVDTRSIEDVCPADLAGFTQHHFFCGAGGWPLALALAGWPADRAIFTGSCPCQPFSAAGKGAGTNDERHLWPAFHHLISQCRPAVIFGEQVASKQALQWWDIVASDLEGSGYACAAADLPAACVQAPHLRSRLFWVATRGTKRRGTADTWEFRELSNADSGRCDGRKNGQGNESNGKDARRAKVGGEFESCGVSGSMADRDEIGRERIGIARGRSAGLAHNSADDGMADSNGIASGQWNAHDRGRAAGSDAIARAGSGSGGLPGELANNNGEVFRREKEPADYAGQEKDRSASDAWRCGEIDRPYEGESFWANADWVGCTDGNWRAAKPGTRVLDARVRGRVVIQRPSIEGGTEVQSHTYSARGAIKGFGNAIVPPLAAEFIRSLM